MSTLFIAKKEQYTLWDFIKDLGKFKDKSEIDYINGDYLFTDDLEYEHKKWYDQSKFNGDIDKFVKIAKKFTFYSEIRGIIFDMDLQIVLKNGTWIEAEYDGEYGTTELVLRKKPERDKK